MVQLKIFDISLALAALAAVFLLLPADPDPEHKNPAKPANSHSRAISTNKTGSHTSGSTPLYWT